MTNHDSSFTAAQAAQQNNRNPDGTYRNGPLAEPPTEALSRRSARTEHAVVPEAEPAASEVPSVPALAISRRTAPTGNPQDAARQRKELLSAARLYAAELMTSNPEFLDALREVSHDTVSKASSSYPALTLRDVEETDREIAHTDLVCPWCGNVGTGGSFFMVSSGHSREELVDLQSGGTVLRLDPSEDADSDCLRLGCASCENAVSVPVGSRISWRI